MLLYLIMTSKVSLHHYMGILYHKSKKCIIQRVGHKCQTKGQCKVNRDSNIATSCNLSCNVDESICCDSGKVEDSYLVVSLCKVELNNRRERER